MALGFKTGGRQKGRHALIAKCDERGVDVFKELLDIALAQKNSDDKFHKLIQLAQYLYAKPREDVDPLTILRQLPLETLRTLIAEAISERKGA